MRSEIQNSYAGILPINKAVGVSSFYLVKILRRLTKVTKIGHAGTLDPFAEGVMILLIGKKYTKKANEFVGLDKEYLANIKLGMATDTFDIEGNVTHTSDYIPSDSEVSNVIDKFQGEINQIPPMFSAKKVNGKKLYELARKGISIERKPQTVNVKTTVLSYEYPILSIKVTCSKGTYIRSIANEIGTMLHTHGHLSSLTRMRVGKFTISDCIDQKDLNVNTVKNLLLH